MGLEYQGSLVHNTPRDGRIIDSHYLPSNENADRDFLISLEYSNRSIRKTKQNHLEVPASIFRAESKQAIFQFFHFLGPKMREGPEIENLNFTSVA